MKLIKDATELSAAIAKIGKTGASLDNAIQTAGSKPLHGELIAKLESLTEPAPEVAPL